MQYLKLVQKEEELIDPKLDSPAVYLAEETGKLAYFKGDFYKFLAIATNGAETGKTVYEQDLDITISELNVTLPQEYSEDDNMQFVVITNKSKDECHYFYINVTVKFENATPYYKMELDPIHAETYEEIGDTFLEKVPDLVKYKGKFLCSSYNTSYNK